MSCFANSIRVWWMYSVTVTANFFLKMRDRCSFETDRSWAIELSEMRENALPILEAAGVDLVLSGHSHSYERSFLIDGHYGLSSTFTAGMKKDGGSGREAGTGVYHKPTAGPAPHDGAVYAVAGSSGQIGGGPLNHPAMYVSLNVLGSMVIDVVNDRLDAKFIDNSPTGTVRDYFTIVKGPLPSTAPTITTATLPDGTIDSTYSSGLSATDGRRAVRGGRSPRRAEKR